MKKIILTAAATALLVSCGARHDGGDAIYSCDAFTVYADSVVQGPFVARAVSPTEITTNYRSPETAGSSPVVKFRFSLNSRDNELPQGKSHTALIGPAAPNDTTVYTFGQLIDEYAAEARTDTLPQNTRWTVRVDMRPVLREFRRNGKYVTAAGDTIYSDDFKGVWIAGSVEPLTWDFENLYGKDDRRLHDRGDSIYEVTLTVNPPVRNQPDPTGWKIDAPVKGYPEYKSGQMLVDALYNMAVSDIASNIRPDSTYRAGKEWDGVWTRDISYSIYLSLAALDPATSMRSLRAKVKNGRIVQDTGTGGSWPVSSDRIVWAVAAWEIYAVSGDKEWLKEAYDIIAATLADDMAVVYDSRYNLMHGEQSYLDWREQTYPRWMEPADIYGSMCLGTNVAFARAFSLMGDMAEELNLYAAEEYRKQARLITAAINDNLWIPQRGYYGEYLYGGTYPILSNTTDNLGQALSIIFNVATPEMASSVISRTPVVTFGTPSVYPQMADIKPYHNDAVWPFVQAFWNLAAAQVRNDEALLAGLGAMWRAAAMWGTDKELFVASTGDYRGTAINSDSQLWSCAGSAAMILRVLCGMNFTPAGIEFHPVIPAALDGDKKISGFRYRDAVIDITVHGSGDKIAGFAIDGADASQYSFPADMKGHHAVEITMANNGFGEQAFNLTDQQWSPATPIVNWSDDGLKADISNHIPGMSYMVYLNGMFLDEIQSDEYSLPAPDKFTTIDIVPVRDQEFSGFTMRPHQVIPAGAMTIIQATSAAKGGTTFIKDKIKAERFVELTTRRNTSLKMKVEVETDGEYFVDVRYANGSGPINTDNKCAIRTLTVNGTRAGAIVMPQRGLGEWLSTGFSNTIAATLHAGTNDLEISYITPENINMNGEVNTALIEYVRIIKK